MLLPVVGAVADRTGHKRGMLLGFGYSYFWGASTIIYLLMRRKVDDTELDEVYLEEDESEEAYSPSAPVAPAPSAPGGQHAPLTMVESPTLRTPPPNSAAAPPAAAEAAPPAKTDGNPPPPANP